MSSGSAERCMQLAAEEPTMMGRGASPTFMRFADYAPPVLKTKRGPTSSESSFTKPMHPLSLEASMIRRPSEISTAAPSPCAGATYSPWGIPQNFGAPEGQPFSSASRNSSFCSLSSDSLCSMADSSTPPCGETAQTVEDLPEAWAQSLSDVTSVSTLGSNSGEFKNVCDESVWNFIEDEAAHTTPPMTPRMAADCLDPGTPPPAPRMMRPLPFLMEALFSNSEKQVRQALVDDPDSARLPFFDHETETPLCYALKHKCSPEIVGLLLEHGADPKMTDHRNKSPADILGSLRTTETHYINYADITAIEKMLGVYIEDEAAHTTPPMTPRMAADCLGPGTPPPLSPPDLRQRNPLADYTADHGMLSQAPVLDSQLLDTLFCLLERTTFSS